MNQDKFSKELFLDFTDFSWEQVFDDTKFVWEALPNIRNFILDQFERKILTANYKDKKDVFVGEGSIIHEGAVIEGPAIIGKNCIIGHCSLLRENCILGDNVHIGHGVEVKNSVFLSNATAAHLNYIGDSVIGNNVNISGGAIMANFRLDKKPVIVRINEEKIDTGLQKFGSVIGDGSSIGVNAVLNPGTILGRNTIVYPLVSVTGVHENDEIIK